MTRLILLGLLLGLLSLDARATINGASFQRTVAVCEDGNREPEYPAGGTDCNDIPPTRAVRYSATFDTAFGGNEPITNGGYVTALTEAGADACTGSAATLAGYVPDSTYMLRREDSETILGSTITPHAGAGFMYQELDVDLDYGNTCANPTSPEDKPRTAFRWNMANFENGSFSLFPWDEIIFYHFSMYVPADLEAENCEVYDLPLRETSVGEFSRQSGGSSGNFLKIGMATVDGGSTDPSMFVQVWTAPASTTTSGVTRYTIWLGDDLGQDRGEWVEWVFKFRINPYASETVVSGTYGGTFQGERGLLEVYRTNPADRTGNLIQVYDMATDTVWDSNGVVLASHSGGIPGDLRNQLGLALNGSYPGAESDIRMYKHAWGTGRGCPPGESTVLTGTYALGIDEIHVGTEETDATTCADVTVNRVSCTER